MSKPNRVITNCIKLLETDNNYNSIKRISGQLSQKSVDQWHPIDLHHTFGISFSKFSKAASHSCR